MKRTKKYLSMFLFGLILLLAVSTQISVYSYDVSSQEQITIKFSDGDIPSGNELLFEDIVVEVPINISNNVIIPGPEFKNITSSKINGVYLSKQLDPETFYFLDGEDDWAYTFTGWHIVGTSEFLPAKTVYQPGDLILEETLNSYVTEEGVLELEAVWGKCYFIKNPYTSMVYTKDSNGKIFLNEEASLTASNQTSPLSSDDNDGRTPETPKATIDGLYSLFAKQSYTDNTQDEYDAYHTVVMLCGNLDYAKDTNGACGNVYGQYTTNSSRKFISASYKSLQGMGSTPITYKYTYKPRGYYNQVYANMRLDNIKFVKISTDYFAGQSSSTEFQLYQGSAPVHYFETTARFNVGVSSSQSAIVTFRPDKHDIVVLNGGSIGSFQTTWSSAISKAGKTIEWYIGRKVSISGNVHCGTTSASETLRHTIAANFKVTLTGGSIGGLYGGSKANNSEVKGNRNIRIIGDGSTSNGEYNPKVKDIYGGADQAKLTGDINLLVKNCNQITNIYGGGDKYTATTYGNINIDIENSTILGDVFGGGKNANSEYLESIAKGGDVKVNIKDSHIQGNVYGSGMGMSQTVEYLDVMNHAPSNWWDSSSYPTLYYPKGWEYPLGYDTDGNLDSIQQYYYPKYDNESGYVLVGASKSVSWSSFTPTTLSFRVNRMYAYLSLATVQNVEINIDESEIGTSTNGKGNVYGGGSIAKVLGNTEINITGDQTKIHGSVYGGGDGVSIPDSVIVYKALSKTGYKMPSYTIDSLVAGIPALTTYAESPTYSKSTYGKFTWSNDKSLLDSETPGIDLDKKLLYSENTIGLGNVQGNTSVNISGGKISGNIFGGGNKGIVEGDTNLTISGNVTASYVYAGCNQADVGGNITLNIQGGIITNAFGGNNLSGDVKGNVSVNMTAGNVTNLYGASNKAPDNFSTSIEIQGGKITNLFGGGLEASVGEVNITTNSGVEITNLFGGGDLGATLGNITINSSANVGTLYGGANKADVTGNITLNINNGVIINAFGGNNLEGNVSGNVFVNVLGGEISYLYGAGNKAPDDYISTLNILNGKVDNLFGGGLEASVQEVNIKTNAGVIIKNLFGGGDAGNTTGNIIIDTSANIENLYSGANQANVGGNISLTINGGTVGNAFGGNNVSGIINGNVDVVINNGTISNLYGAGNQASDDYKTTIKINNGNVLELYGGGLEASVGSTEIVVVNGIIGSIYGGGYAGNVDSTTKVTINGGQISGNIYGGGYAGTVNSTTVELNDSNNPGYLTVNGSVFGGGEGKTASVYLSTNVIINLQLEMLVTETAFTTDTISGKSEVKAEITSSKYSKILGNVYGGGDLGQVGVGSINASTNTATIQQAGKSTVLISNGYIEGNIFGAGSGIPKGNTRYDIEMGTIFGSTDLTVNGGFIGGNIYGGGTQSRLYAESAANHPVADVKIIENGSKIYVTGSVFGGGERGNSATTNASIPTTIGNVVVTIQGIKDQPSNIYFEQGGVYGDGNLCLVSGDRTINIVDFNTNSDVLKTFYSLQRANTVNVENSAFVLLGAIDLVEEGDITEYSINRIGQLNLLQGSIIKLDQIVKYLGSILSDYNDYHENRDFLPRNVQTYSTKSLNNQQLTEDEIARYIADTSGLKNVICVANGLYLEIIKEGDVPEYGSVTGLFTLQLLIPVVGEGGGFVYASSEDSTGDFICETLISDVPGSNGEKVYMPVVDSYGGFSASYGHQYYWYIQGNIINYYVSLEGYIGSDQEVYQEDTITPMHDEGLLYVLNTVKGNDILKDALNSNKYTLVSKSENLSGNEIAIELRLGSYHWFLKFENETWYLTQFIKSGTDLVEISKSGFNDEVTEIQNNILAENVIVDSENSKLSVILHKSKDVNAEVSDMMVDIEIGKYTKDSDNTYHEYSAGTSKLVYKINFRIIRLVPTQALFYGPSKNYTGLLSSESIRITYGSSFTLEYQTRYIPGAFPNDPNDMYWFLRFETYSYYVDKLGNYMTLDSNGNVISISPTLTRNINETKKIYVTKNYDGSYSYKHNGETISFDELTTAQTSYLPKGTKITLIDSTNKDNPGYYYYICDTDMTKINVEDFMYMGTTTKISDGAKPTFVSYYESEQAYRITERMIFIFDFEQIELPDDIVSNIMGSVVFEHAYGSAIDKSLDIMDYVKSVTEYNNVTYTRIYPSTAEFEMCVSKDEDGVDNFELEFEHDSYPDDEEATLNVSITQDDEWFNTKLSNGNLGIMIKAGGGGKLPDGIEFKFNGVSYYPLNDNQYVIIPISKYGTYQITVMNLLGTIETTHIADLTATLTYLPSSQHYNDKFVYHNPIVDEDIKCTVDDVEHGSILVTTNKRVISKDELLEFTLTLQNTLSNVTSVEIYYKSPNGYIKVATGIILEGSDTFTLPMSRYAEEAGTYKIVFRNGINEEILTIIVV